MSLFKKALQENFIIVAISTGLTMNEESNPVIVSLINSSTPFYWEFLNPDGYITYFRSKQSSSRQRAEKLSSSVQDLILNDNRFASFKVGTNEGLVITEINWRGKVTMPPLGDTVNIAYRNQKGRQDLNKG